MARPEMNIEASSTCYCFCPGAVTHPGTDEACEQGLFVTLGQLQALFGLISRGAKKLALPRPPATTVLEMSAGRMGLSLACEELRGNAPTAAC